MPPCAAKSNTVSPGQALLLSLSASCFEVVSVAVTAAVFLAFFPPFLEERFDSNTLGAANEVPPVG